ncbi:LamG-like jellyroll fold domain-containing protein [Flavobacterium sp.]|uniref:LamG-like jellyroll fold domain-containing protein n=1 Tax=Flavobacterium sp. TaxID=239 RepID=UPI0035B0B67C
MNKKLLTLMLMVVGLEVIAQTPIYHFTFDNTLQDVSNSHVFALNPGVPATATPTFTSGESSGSYALAISGTYNVQVNLANLPQGNAARTIMMRVQSYPTGSATNPLWVYGGNGALQKLSLTHDNNGSSNLMTDTVSTSSIATNCGINSLSNSWYLVTVTYDGTTLKIYRDSHFLLSETVNLATAGNLLKIGQFLESTSTVSGVGFKVDDLKIFDSALTAQQIGAIYSNGADLNNGLLAFYDFENNLNSSTGNHNLTAQGAMAYVTGIEGGASKAGSFSGTNLAYTTSLDAVFNTQQFTVAFWEYRPSSAINSAYDTSYEAFGSQYFRVRQGIPRISAAYNASTYFTETNLNGYVGVWKHYAIVFKKLASSSVISVYEDGIFMVSTVVTNAVDLYKFNNKFTIGGGTDAAGNFLSSKFAHTNIDKFFVYNRALSVQEINLLKDQHQAFLSVNDFNSPELLEAEIYPNPVQDVLIINVDNAIKSVEVFTLQGQKVLNSTSNEVDMSSLNSGIYLVKITDENNSIATKKVVKR